MSNPKPHRRMSLTTPTVAPPAASTPASDSTTSNTNGTAVAAGDGVVRVMAYLSPEEAEVLDDLWFRLRRLPSRPSKSDLLRAALLLAAQTEAQLTDVLTQQRTNTLSRQRARKSRA